jgi:hypothetical protein
MGIHQTCAEMLDKVSLHYVLDCLAFQCRVKATQSETLYCNEKPNDETRRNLVKAAERIEKVRDTILVEKEG